MYLLNMYSRRQKKFTYRTYGTFAIREKNTFELTVLLPHFVRTTTALCSYFYRTFIVPMPYLFRRIYYSDEYKSVLLVASYRCFLLLLVYCQCFFSLFCRCASLLFYSHCLLSCRYFSLFLFNDF